MTRALLSIIALAVLAWLSSGCEKHVASENQAPLANAARPEVPMSHARPRPDGNGLLPVTGDWHGFVGVLRENQRTDAMQPADYCLDDGMHYEGARYRLGRVNVFGVDDDLAGLGKAQAAIVYGTRQPSLLSMLRTTGPCPDVEELMAQMRSDWVADEGGYRTSRDKLAGLPYIQGRAALGVTLFEVVATDETSVRVRIGNPFDAPYREMEVVAHYEGGPGKPMPLYKEQGHEQEGGRARGLEPGASVEVTVARSADPDGTRPATKMGYGLHSIQLRGYAGNAEIDADLVVPHH